MAIKEAELVRALVTLEAPPEIKKKIANILSIVKKTEIKDDAQYEKSGNVLDNIALVGKAINAHYDPECDRRNKLHKEATAARSDVASPVKDAYLTWQGKIKAYKSVLDDRIAEEQRKLEEEARRKAEDEKIALAAELEKTGKQVEAEAVIEDTTPPIIVTPKVMAPVAKGVTVRKKWSAEVTDLKALVVAIAAGQAPISLVTVDKTALRKFSESTQGSLQINGIRFSSEELIGRKGKRGK